MTSHGKKMIAPIIITILFLLYLIVYGILVLKAAVAESLVVLMGIPLVLLGIGMMNDARALATKRMVAEAEAIGADAIVAVRYSSASVMQSAAEVMAYGTAVKFKN